MIKKTKVTTSQERIKEKVISFLKVKRLDEEAPTTFFIIIMIHFASSYIKRIMKAASEVRKIIASEH